MKLKLLTIIFILYPAFFLAQTKTENKKSEKYFKQALVFFDKNNLSEAIIFCNKSINKDQLFTEPYVLKAQILHKQKQTNLAINNLKKVIEIDNSYKQIYYILGTYLLEEQNFDEAEKYISTYRHLDGDTSRHKATDKLIELIKFRKYNYNNPLNINTTKLSANINTNASEYFPTITADGNTLIFTKLDSTNINSDENIFISKKRNNEFQKAVNIGLNINSNANEGAHTISADGNIMIFTRCTINNSCDLYITQKTTNQTWQTPVKLPSPINSRYWESQPSLSPDGKTLYFASNRPGGKGKMDLWKTNYLGNGKWSTPENLDSNINTKGNEMCPFIHFDNNTLYFSSDYRIGMGGFDLFYSKKNAQSWTKAKNLGFPINTKQNEFRLTIDANSQIAYFSTEKDKTTHQDIYYFNLPDKLKPQKTIFISIDIVDEQNNSIKADNILVADINNNDTIIFYKNIKSTAICLNHDKQYSINILKKNYLFFSDNIILDTISDTIKYIHHVITLKKITNNNKINLKNTFFDTDSYNIKTISFVELNKLVEFLMINPDIKIEIAGHTDNIGTAKHNIKLSENRANSVKNYLISKNIAPNRLLAKGYGATKPIADNNSEIGRELNRRTEIIILKK